MSTDMDRISELPNDMKEMILVRLPIKDAVKTSCLSSKWRYAWTYIPDLVFIEATVSLIGNSSERGSELAKLVDIVLLLHQGRIQKFTLEYYHVHLNAVIHRWMVILSRNKIKELSINMALYWRWNMPSSFFSTSTLTDVRLMHCVLKLPRSFHGLKLLESLELCYCTIGNKDLENLISSCSHLERLLLSGMDGMFLRIRAPKLKHLHLRMYRLEHVHLITPNLVDASLSLNFTIRKNNWKPILNDAFGSLSNMERLEIGPSFMEFLASVGNLKFPVKFTHLKKIVCHMDPSNQKENAFAFCMFQNAPSLEILEIFARRDGPIETFWEHTMPTILFGNLKIVEIRYYYKYLADFILPVVKLLLATSPVLVSLRFVGPDADENVVYLNKLLSFKRASMEAQILV